MSKKIFIYILFSAFILSACTTTPSLPTEKQDDEVQTSHIAIETPEDKNGLIPEPINNAQARVTKKPFGIKISPENSPVTPERFYGYHTGVDFEIFSGEEESDISIYTICTGPLTFKRHANGYGGVAVQQCTLDNSDVIVIYGHLKLSSIYAELNQTLNQGQQIGILGQGYSKETDGERKHLHLGIRKGKIINLLGYVRDPGRLDEWIDVLTLIK